MTMTMMTMMTMTITIMTSKREEELVASKYHNQLEQHLDDDFYDNDNDFGEKRKKTIKTSSIL